MKPLLLSIVLINVTNVTYLLMSTQTENQRKAFGRLLRNLREDLKLEQEEAAQRAGMSRQQWNRLETGQSGTRLETLERIATALELKPERQEFDSVYRYAGYAPPLDQQDGVQSVTFIPGPIQNNPDGMFFDPRDAGFAPDDPILVSIIAHYEGSPAELRPKMLGEIARIVREHQREQTDFGKKAAEEQGS